MMMPLGNVSQWWAKLNYNEPMWLAGINQLHNKLVKYLFIYLFIYAVHFSVWVICFGDHSQHILLRTKMAILIVQAAISQ